MQDSVECAILTRDSEPDVAIEVKYEEDLFGNYKVACDAGGSPNHSADKTPKAPDRLYSACSKHLQQGSEYFRTALSPRWCKASDSGGGRTVSVSGHDPVALDTLLYAIHGNWDSVPINPSVDLIKKIVTAIDYFQSHPLFTHAAALWRLQMLPPSTFAGHLDLLYIATHFQWPDELEYAALWVRNNTRNELKFLLPGMESMENMLNNDRRAWVKRFRIVLLSNAGRQKQYSQDCSTCCWRHLCIFVNLEFQLLHTEASIASMLTNIEAAGILLKRIYDLDDKQGVAGRHECGLGIQARDSNRLSLEGALISLQCFGPFNGKVLR